MPKPLHPCSGLKILFALAILWLRRVNGAHFRLCEGDGVDHDVTFVPAVWRYGLGTENGQPQKGDGRFVGGPVGARHRLGDDGHEWLERGSLDLVIVVLHRAEEAPEGAFTCHCRLCGCFDDGCRLSRHAGKRQSEQCRDDGKQEKLPHRGSSFVDGVEVQHN